VLHYTHNISEQGIQPPLCSFPSLISLRPLTLPPSLSLSHSLSLHPVYTACAFHVRKWAARIAIAGKMMVRETEKERTKDRPEAVRSIWSFDHRWELGVAYSCLLARCAHWPGSCEAQRQKIVCVCAWLPKWGSMYLCVWFARESDPLPFWNVKTTERRRAPRGFSPR